ncbi:PTS sugar transporter subunit IIB [Pelolinea submarina]|uniref:PTS system cellobiose-specific IIB component n=1 Tax=Pelolinea submarina TaxID=913107 RepID=A0A3E0APD1_9CHLR|nr:PTS sugar transporter subunit IIB [Pelolinea submarina]REG11830.1 PTS system cellobiose-specific IIB component [Pelolinea submarina]
MEKKQIRILLVCGSGASSGFMASNIRKAAVKRGLDVTVTARSEAEIENYINDIDCLMIGPHLAYLEEDVSKIIQGKDIKVALMKPDYYATLNGEQALDHIVTLFK